MNNSNFTISLSSYLTIYLCIYQWSFHYQTMIKTTFYLYRCLFSFYLVWGLHSIYLSRYLTRSKTASIQIYFILYLSIFYNKDYIICIYLDIFFICLDIFLSIYPGWGFHSSYLVRSRTIFYLAIFLFIYLSI